MKVQVSYYAQTPATAAKHDVIVAGFASLEGLSRTAVSRTLNELKIRGGWRDELARAGVHAVLKNTSDDPSLDILIGYDAELNTALEIAFEGKLPESFAAEVIADDSGVWANNQLRFATADEAGKYAADLFSRWTACRKTRVQPSPDFINARWKDGHLERLQS